MIHPWRPPSPRRAASQSDPLATARHLLGRLRETLEESTVPVRVDLVDLQLADPAFRRAVLAEALEWTV